MEQQWSRITLLRTQLQSSLEEMRYEHSLSVSFTCLNLAMCHGYNMDKAELAGLIHDCGKEYCAEALLKKCLEHNIELTEAERNALPVIHAKYGAWLAENKYQITDREILDAICCHTTGKPEMTTLDKILYIADYIEPRRCKASELPRIRKLAFVNLDETMYLILSETLEYLKKRGGVIDPTTVEAYEYFKKMTHK